MNELVKLCRNSQQTTLLFGRRSVIPSPGLLDVYRASPYLYTGMIMIEITNACQECGLQVLGGAL